MTRVTFLLPDDIAHGLTAKWKDLPRAALESVALEAYRCGALTAAQARRLLGFSTRFELDAFLKRHGVCDYTLEDLEKDRKGLRRLSGGGC
jgi:hypothetical protein